MMIDHPAMIIRAFRIAHSRDLYLLRFQFQYRVVACG